MAITTITQLEATINQSPCQKPWAMTASAATSRTAKGARGRAWPEGFPAL